MLIAGAGTAGMSAARFLSTQGARLTLVDNRFDNPSVVVGASELAAAGARLFTAGGFLDTPQCWSGIEVVIASPGFAPTNDLMVAAADAGVPIWGEVELAWQVDRAGLLGAPRTWLVVTGTNGKTTTTSMLAEIVAATESTDAPIRGMACGNIGMPVLDAMLSEPRVEVLCVELSSFQLHWAPSVTPRAGVVLNIADDHLDWHGSFDAYAGAKAGALRGEIGLVGLDDAVASSLSASGRRIGFTLAEPEVGQLGVCDGTLIDRAFADAQPLIDADVIHPAGPSGRADALAAAGLALAAGVPVTAVTAGLTSFRPGGHRGEVVAQYEGVDFIDDSKATNPHAAQAAIAAHRCVVLIAGGLLKGASVDDLIRTAADRLAGVVVIGRDRDIIVEAIARHAPQVPTVTVFTGEDGAVNVQHAAPAPDHTGFDPIGPTVASTAEYLTSDGLPPAEAVMTAAVDIATELATTHESGHADAVLLAPAAASLDMFTSYGARGDAFAAAAQRSVAARQAVQR